MGVQIIHHTDRAADPDDVRAFDCLSSTGRSHIEQLRQMEITFGEDQGKLNLDTRGNLMPGESGYKAILLSV